MFLDCLDLGKMVRNHRRVAPAAEEDAAVYTIPMERSSSSGLDCQARPTEYKGVQFDSDLNLIETQFKSPCTAEEQRGLGQSATDMKSRSRSRRLALHLALDLPVLALVTVVVCLLEFGVIPSHRAGYFCQDAALNYPFIRDTVSMSLLVLSAVGLPFFLMYAVEYVLYRPSEYSLQTKRWLESLKISSLWYWQFMYGLVLNFLTVEIMKMTMGNPRPTFFDICQPEGLTACTKGEYIASYKCTSTRFSEWFVLDASRSFPSGHTSFSVGAGLFMAWYLQRRAFSWRNRSALLVPLLQLLCVLYAAVCSLTRITDHRHHWWDVLAGFFVGVLTTLYTVLVLCKNFACPTTASTSDISASDSSAHNHASVRRLLSGTSSEHALPHAHIAHAP